MSALPTYPSGPFGEALNVHRLELDADPLHLVHLAAVQPHLDAVELLVKVHQGEG
jgi:hypothetical protein